MRYTVTVHIRWAYAEDELWRVTCRSMREVCDYLSTFSTQFLASSVVTVVQRW